MDQELRRRRWIIHRKLGNWMNADLAQDMLEGWKPTAMVSVGKKSMNKNGVYHSHTGLDISHASAKVDSLFIGSRSHRITAVGIEDHLINIGFASIIEEIKTEFLQSLWPPKGSGCACPCKSMM